MFILSVSEGRHNLLNILASIVHAYMVILTGNCSEHFSISVTWKSECMSMPLISEHTSAHIVVQDAIFYDIAITKLLPMNIR